MVINISLNYLNSHSISLIMARTSTSWNIYLEINVLELMMSFYPWMRLVLTCLSLNNEVFLVELLLNHSQPVEICKEGLSFRGKESLLESFVGHRIAKCFEFCHCQFHKGIIANGTLKHDSVKLCL